VGYLGPRCCGATLIGSRVTGVRVTPISGCFVGRGRTVGLTTAGASFTTDGSGGGGGGGGGGSGGDCLTVAVANGVVVGGSILHGAPEWSAKSNGFLYKDTTLAQHGLQKIKLKLSDSILVKAKGAGAGVVPLSVTFPVTAQLVNLDTGACWASVFTAAKKNEASKVVALLP